MTHELSDAALSSLLTRHRAASFGAGFASRVLRRTQALARPSLGGAMQRWFVWMVPAAVTAIAALAVLNARATHAPHAGLDAVLGLPAVTLEAAYSFDAGSGSPVRVSP